MNFIQYSESSETQEFDVQYSNDSYILRLYSTIMDEEDMDEDICFMKMTNYPFQTKEKMINAIITNIELKEGQKIAFQTSWKDREDLYSRLRELYLIKEHTNDRILIITPYPLLAKNARKS